MSENRTAAVPYISHLRITYRPTQKWVPTGRQNPLGQDLLQQMTDRPGIACEIIPYMGSIAGPAHSFSFPSRKFFEDALASLQAIENKSTQVNQAISSIEATLARTDVTWAESILTAAGIGTLDTLWVDVISDALDQFPSWNESANSNAGGIPLKILVQQLDARLPADGGQSIELKIGLYAVDNSGNPIGEPTTYTLLFEDATTRDERLAVNQQLITRIATLENELADLPEETSAEDRESIESELADRQSTLTQRQAVEIGQMSLMLAQPSVQQSLPLMLMAIVGVLKATQWPDLDLPLITQRLAARLAAMMPSEDTE